MASSMAIKTLAAFPLTRSPLTKSLSSLVRLVSFSTKSDDDDAIPTAGISRPLADILKELNKKVPDSLVRLRTEDGFNIKYIPWHIVNRIMNLHAPEWSGEVRNITYSADGKSVSVVYRVTLYGTDAEYLFLYHCARYIGSLQGLLRLMILVMEILYKRLKRWHFDELVLALGSGFIFIMRICCRKLRGCCFFFSNQMERVKGLLW